MEYLKDNNCPDIDCKVFYRNDKPFLIASKITDKTSICCHKQQMENGCFEYKGMKRMKLHFGWVFQIDEDNLYFVSVY